MIKPKLISFKLCPFAQRAAIVLNHKRVEYDIEYIDLASPPAWFTKLSPLKKVPILLVGDNVIFDSVVINEYLDEAYPNQLHPQDIIVRAMNRSWIEFGNDCMWSMYHLSMAETEAKYNVIREILVNKFDQIEKVLIGTPYFNGKAFSLVDASYAPFFQYLAYLDEISSGFFDTFRHPKINIWKSNLLKLESVKKSCVTEVGQLYREQLQKRQGYISTLLVISHGQDIVKSNY